MVKEKNGNRNCYQIQAHLPLMESTHPPLPDSISRERTIGEVLDLLVDARGRGGRR